jgi:hypothetical protein
VDLLRGTGENIAPGALGAMVVGFVEAAYRSARKNAPIAIPPIRRDAVTNRDPRARRGFLDLARDGQVLPHGCSLSPPRQPGEVTAGAGPPYPRGDRRLIVRCRRAPLRAGRV